MPKWTDEELEERVNGESGDDGDSNEQLGVPNLLGSKITLSNGQEVYVTWAAIQGLSATGMPVTYYIPSFDSELPPSQLAKEIKRATRMVWKDDLGEERIEVPSASDLSTTNLPDEAILTYSNYASLIKGLTDNGISEEDINSTPFMSDYLMQHAQVGGKPNELFYLGMQKVIQKVKENPQYADKILAQLPGYPQPQAGNETGQDIWNLLTVETPQRKDFPDEKAYQQAIMQRLQPQYQDFSKQEELGLFNRQYLRNQKEQGASALLNEYERASQRFDALTGGTPQEGLFGAAATAQEEADANERQEAAMAKRQAELNTIASEKQRRWEALLNQSRRPQQVARL